MRKEYGGMGFRHPYGFNLAMVGKQGWRLETNHDTIVARVFKARYFPRGNFVDVKLGHNPSYVWRSIHASQVIVRGGLRWRLGDDSHIRTWYDPWINDEGRAYATSNIPPGMKGMMVSELVEKDNHEWKVDVIKEVFNERDAKNILAMPIIDEIGEDKQCWKFTSHGECTVKSAYHYTMEILVDNDKLREEDNWWKIWRLQIP
jgi:hypothetical protein